MLRFFALAMLMAAGASVAEAQAPRTFSVQFGENETQLSGDARAALGVAIEMAQECEKKASVSLVGHDDATHPAQKADEISMARAETVRKTMVDAGGINADFKMEARGRSQLPVPTADGVSERQNRRVDISIACS